MRVRTKLVTAAVVVWLAVPLAGCGGQDLVIGGPGLPTAVPTSGTPTPTCGATGDPCTFGTDCCSGACNLFGQCV
jgi:hypothetical protein